MLIDFFLLIFFSDSLPFVITTLPITSFLYIYFVFLYTFIALYTNSVF